MTSGLGDWRRTHSNGGLRRADVGREVTLMGWVQTRRDLGGLIFIDLRDREGVTQVVFTPQDAPAGGSGGAQVQSESVVAVRGSVAARPAGTVNPKIPTGEVEVRVRDLRILNPAETPPFPIADEVEVDEALRLTYRYLDLRRPVMYRHLALRHRLTKAVRDHLSAAGFLEVETPMLIKSTPEGARDFLVPSRLHPGKFYVLPQSPQLFKQLLMVGGVERYFQIVRCFRDEDGRADRQPEFTQIDVEMSFVGIEDVVRATEAMVAAVVRDALGITVTTPFPRMTYAEAMDRYGTDKPDLRFSMPVVDCSDLLRHSEFQVFARTVEAGGAVRGICVPKAAELSRRVAVHHPFTAPLDEDLPLLEHSPLRARAKAYDLVLNGVELGGGSIRIHQQEMQSRLFQILGISPEQARDRFGFLLEAFRYGAPPHGGIALGLDRAVMMLAGQETIREVIAFPKTQSAADLMTGAPSAVDPAALDEVHIRLKIPPR